MPQPTAPTALDPDQLLTPAEAAPVLRCGVDYVWQLCREGKLPHMRKGNFIQIRRQDLSDYIAAQIRQAMGDGD